ncbi:hypothetical protein PRIPAC_86562 [Pristionchus pacificus]|uniref:Uncharacterized protein n=1 Tax=Pristionchus pacificus TaxID=54126 RepID=A0A2A6BKW5_PRIPA|nr:hypothetical protein PRIPAC_86562 [Pristionchus pacificus]|eukprot:PDM66456.1 hypothetical protein PRIPAC_47873 [Pristionchus pacificus]
MPLPPNIGYDGLRYFSAAIYDLWLSIVRVVVISAIPFHLSKNLSGQCLRTIDRFAPMPLDMWKNGEFGHLPKKGIESNVAQDTKTEDKLNDTDE